MGMLIFIKLRILNQKVSTFTHTESLFPPFYILFADLEIRDMCKQYFSSKTPLQLLDSLDTCCGLVLWYADRDGDYVQDIH